MAKLDGKTADRGPGKVDGARPDGAAAGEWIGLVRGALFTTDLVAAKTTHDQVAGGGESGAKAAGNVHHNPLLSTDLLGATPNLFASVDRWTNSAGLAIYQDATFKAALGSLFDSKGPTVETFKRQSDWLGWGDFDSGKSASPYYVAIVRGKLNFTDQAAAKAAHDAVAGGGQSQVQAAGDVAHVVHLGTSDWTEFLDFDVWTDSSKIAAIYGDPNFQKAFNALFVAGSVSLVVYKSTDWHSW